MDLEELDMYGQQSEELKLFDDIDDTSVSGNEDPLDNVKSVCLSCGGVNGQHSSSCDEDFDLF